MPRVAFKTTLMACCAAVSVIAVIAAPVHAQTASMAFRIEGQPLDQALIEFARAADVQVLFTPELVRGKRAGAVSGTLSPREALATLLNGTGVGIRSVSADGRTFSLGATDVAGAEPEVVVVTALKRTAAIAKVPAAVVAINGTDIRERGIVGADGLVDEIPGVSINYSTGGTGYGLLSIRGIGGADDYKPNGSPSVALHVDGIYQTSNAYVGMPLFDLERIEVLKGPQGTLYGRNTTAGVINAITRGPSEAFEGYADVRAGNFDYTRFETAFGGKVSENFGVRLAVMAENGGGFMNGEGAGTLAGFRPTVGGIVQTQVPAVTDPGKREGFGDKDMVAARATFSFDFTPQTNLTVKAFASRDRGDSRQYDRLEKALDNTQFNAGENADPYSFYSQKYFTHAYDIRGLSGTLTHRVKENLNFTVVGGVQSTDRTDGGNGDGSPYPGYEYAFDEKLSQASLEMRLSDDNGGKFDWIVGAFYLTDSADFDSTWTSFTVRSVYDNNHKQRRNSFAVFGQADYNVTEKLRLSGGLRFTRDTVDYKGQNIDHNPWGISIYNSTFATVSGFSWDRDFEDDNLSGRLTAQYFVNDNFNLFASASTGYRGGGFDGTSIMTLEETYPFESETVTAYEAGARWYKGRFRASLDVFSYKFKNLQATTRLANDTNGRTNVGKAETSGVDLAVGVRLFDGQTQKLDLDLSAAFLDSEITEYISRRAADVAATVGDPLPGAPDVTANLSLKHQVAFTGGWYLTSRLTVAHHGEESNRLNALPNNTAEPYTLTNVHVELASPASWSVYAFGKNVTDEVYFPELNGAARLVGAPATYGVGLRYRF
ncbi:TonB-dependent receptor domain-containing protein [Asticcacaulis excentricus]|uniref:TonB-dependent receptor n=1 Tax=Asticcacaulis excentricus (strain ATCC 15261 / DSM 4724 / KCTC 12464 / NCIMB 9791 / VKM B-1370 / CB 48) TaxID=573065 RepID=E8RUF9_ASTEC|nr:TonB-dependent receptor [Asticcacaulis excentricus]ADU14047.1 TonB-dependent receptor [Asticcacaulis excentricus CB 48]